MNAAPHILFMRGVFMSHLFSCRSSGFLYFLAAPAVLVFLLLSIVGGASPASSSPDPRAAAAAAFLSGCGWEADPLSCQCAEVAVPEQFGEVYRQYNELQRSQGFDLTPYRGQKAVRFTFPLEDYPAPKEAGPVYANVLFVGDTIAAADICAVGARGFIRPVRSSEFGVGERRK